MATALGGIRVLDFTHALSGPYCTLLLADFGATVYKLESPEGGDMGRGWGPPFAGDYASFFLGLNRGKLGLSIDLKQPEGLALVWRLIAEMDVLIENFRPGTLERLGLGYAAVSARHPKLIYCSISGYGQNGPSRMEPAMDLVVECSSGFLSITGTESGELVRSGYAVADINAGLFATIGILTALRARETTGRGQQVDISMMDAMISAMCSNYLYFLGSGVTPGPLGTAFQTVVPYRVYQARDGAFSIAVGSEKLWAAFCQAIERPDLTAHPDYATNPRRAKNRLALDAVLADVFAPWPLEECRRRLTAAGIPFSAVRNLAEVVADPQTAVRGLFPEVSGAAQRVVGPPFALSETPGRVTTTAPALGQDTRRVLTELLGVNDRELAALAEKRVVL